MKKLLLLGAALLLGCLSIQAQTTNTTTENAVKIPAGAETPIRWEYAPDPEVSIFRLYSATNLIRTFTSTNYTVLGSTNRGGTNFTIYRAMAPERQKGWEMLTVAAVDSIGQPSNPSNILPLQVLGKPSPPQALAVP